VHFKKGGQSIQATEKELFYSIQRSYDLYHYLLGLIVEVAEYANERVELNRNKNIPSYEELHPNTRFIDNKLIQQIKSNIQLNEYLSSTKLSWVNNPELIKKLYNTITDTEFYTEYMAKEKCTYADDKKLLITIYNNIFAEMEDVYLVLEEQSIYWNDEIDFILSMVSKTLKGFEAGAGEEAGLMPKFKDADDEHFVKTLVHKCLFNHVDNQKIIQVNTQNWEVDRIAFMDMLIMEMAIVEMIEFDSIPVKVSFNEYLDLSKLYSTQKSSTFINGILDKIAKQLTDEGKIVKIGRGLVDN